VADNAPGEPAATPAESWTTAFLSKLVHELHTPLASMRIAAEILGDDPRLPASLATVTTRLGTAVDDLDELLGELGELNRIRAGRLQPNVAVVDVPGLLRAVQAASESDVAAAGAEITVDASAPSGSPIVSDAKLLTRALGCLVRSACAAGAKQVELGARQSASGLILEVRDDGPAPTTAEQAQIFEPLAPFARTRRRHGGTSLALPLARAIANLLGGDLTAASADQRTALTLELPRA
jgi:signal transduction histidine kinase